MNHSVKTTELLHFKVLVPYFLVKNVRRSKCNLLRFQEENLKPVVGKSRVLWELKVYLIAQSAQKGSTTWKKSLTCTSHLQKKQIDQWSNSEGISSSHRILKVKRITANLTDPCFIQATFRTCFFSPVPSFSHEIIKLPDYNRRITTRDNDNVQSDDQEESKLNSSINANWCLYTFTWQNNKMSI